MKPKTIKSYCERSKRPPIIFHWYFNCNKDIKTSASDTCVYPFTAILYSMFLICTHGIYLPKHHNHREAAIKLTMPTRKCH